MRRSRFAKKHFRSNQCGLFVLFTILLCTFLLPFFSANIAYADDTQPAYTSVLADLNKDPDFAVADYPVQSDDYSLSVVQVAESCDAELFIYVYHPAARFIATSINANLIDDGTDFAMYSLELLSSADALYKYKVVGFSVPDIATREYTIISIFRPWVKEVDCAKDANGDYLEREDGNEVTEVSYAVGKKYTFDSAGVICVDVEYIEVTDKYVGFCRYMDGPHFFPNNYDCCDSHFVAFSTGRRIDKLLYADVFYTSQFAMYSIGITASDPFVFAAKEDKVANLSYTDRAEYNGGGLFGYTYSWNKIQSVEDFLASENSTTIYSCGVFDLWQQNTLDSTATAALQDKQWVLRFAETAYSKSTTPAMMSVEYHTIVGDVSLLRLQYETAGHVYDLGVVDNKQTGSGEPVNSQETAIHLPAWLVTLLTIVFWVFVVLICLPLLPSIIKLVWLIVKYAAIAIWYIVKYLAIGIYWIFAWPFHLKK